MFIVPFRAGRRVGPMVRRFLTQHSDALLGAGSTLSRVGLTFAFVLFVAAAPVRAEDLNSYIDAQWTANRGHFTSMASAGDGDSYYYLQYALMGWLSAYEAYGDITYLTRVLSFAETMAASATNVDSCGQRSWSGTYTNSIAGCRITNAAQD